jgi:iron(III) transport system ATP-binding protein
MRRGAGQPRFGQGDARFSAPGAGGKGIMAAITLDGVSKRFGRQTALRDVALDLPQGSFTALLGPSGCGKTTVLRLIAGFERPSAGRVLIDGEVVSTPETAVPPEARRLGVVFQSYALWPHLTVAGNAAYPLEARRRPKAEVVAGTAAALAQVGMSAYADRAVDALSGGQRQRVALARALAAETRAVLFDEPLANLDAHLRGMLVEEFRRLHRETGRTMVYVTHDQTEAIALADRLVVMEGGRVLQADAPQTVYRTPSCAAVAAFVGRGAVVDAVVERVAENRARLRLGGVIVDARCAAGAKPGPALALLRPEALSLDAEGPLTARVLRATYRGATVEIEAEIAGSGRVCLDADPDAAPRPGVQVRLRLRDAWVVPPG